MCHLGSALMAWWRASPGVATEVLEPLCNEWGVCGEITLRHLLLTMLASPVLVAAVPSSLPHVFITQHYSEGDCPQSVFRSLDTHFAAVTVRSEILVTQRVALTSTSSYFALTFHFYIWHLHLFFNPSMSIWSQVVFFFFFSFWWYWGLNLGHWACCTTWATPPALSAF
jgi:hypothetical protein